MNALGKGGFWWNFPYKGRAFRPRRKPNASNRGGGGGGAGGGRGGWFPLKQAAIASSLTFTGDAIAQARDRWVISRRRGLDSDDNDFIAAFLSNYDWLRALRMASYGFLLYGPGSYAWYKLLDHWMPMPTFTNLSVKVLLNQIVLGPCVIGVIFAWNNLWLGKLSELPNKYQKDALPSLLYGFRFWIPVSILNFTVVPLSLRVAFMSSCSIFWNYYLSTTMSK